MNILILNWRDIKNPAGGGAEILTHELAKGWVKKGNKVIHFSSEFTNSKNKETVDGVKIIRKGRWWSVHIFALFYYLQNQSRTDIIIDEVHWFPFFSALYARKKTVALTCEVANILFFTLFPYPLALILRRIEKVYLRLYRNVPTMAISESTKKDLVREGINPKLITVLNMGINIPKNLKKYPKEKNPTFIYLARINKQKGIFDAIDAFEIIKNQFGESKSKIKNPQFWIVGSGEKEIVNEVKDNVKNCGLSDCVKFFGFVSEEKKFELLARAHILLSPSAHEGWGLTIPEAGLTRTPAVVYNTQGFRDIIDNSKDGLLVENKPIYLAKGATQLINNKVEYRRMQDAIFVKSKKYSWNRTALESLKFINKAYETGQ